MPLLFGDRGSRATAAGVSADERDWLNAYHARVREAVAPQLTGDDLVWLEAACAPV